MVDLLLFIWVREKCFCHKSVYEDFIFPFIPPECNNPIAVIIIPIVI